MAPPAAHGWRIGSLARADAASRPAGWGCAPPTHTPDVLHAWHGFSANCSRTNGASRLQRWLTAEQCFCVFFLRVLFLRLLCILRVLWTEKVRLPPQTVKLFCIFCVFCGPPRLCLLWTSPFVSFVDLLVCVFCGQRKAPPSTEGGQGLLGRNGLGGGQPMSVPEAMSPSVVMRRSVLPCLAARSIPADSTPRSTAGLRLATTTMVLPTSSSGW